MPTIVMVEDDPTTARFYSSAFQSEGFQVAWAENGQLGFELIIASQPDLVVSDVQMPVMTGLELLAKLKATPETCQIPVVMLTSSSGPEIRQQAQEAALFLVKGQHGPHEIVHLVSQVIPGLVS